MPLRIAPHERLQSDSDPQPIPFLFGIYPDAFQHSRHRRTPDRLNLRLSFQYFKSLRKRPSISNPRCWRDRVGVPTEADRPGVADKVAGRAASAWWATAIGARRIVGAALRRKRSVYRKRLAGCIWHPVCAAVMLGPMHNPDASTCLSIRTPRRRRSDDTQRPLLARYHRSGLTQRTFCEPARIPLTTRQGGWCKPVKRTPGRPDRWPSRRSWPRWVSSPIGTSVRRGPWKSRRHVGSGVESRSATDASPSTGLRQRPSPPANHRRQPAPAQQSQQRKSNPDRAGRQTGAAPPAVDGPPLTANPRPLAASPLLPIRIQPRNPLLDALRQTQRDLHRRQPRRHMPNHPTQRTGHHHRDAVK